MLTETERGPVSWLYYHLSFRVDAAGLRAFRRLFGLLMLISTVRFAALGWIDSLYLGPTFHFSYLGFEWVQPWPGPGMYAHFVVMGLAALGLALDLRPRLCAGVFFLAFTYVELLEKAAYLNHYYLVSLLALLLTLVPIPKGPARDSSEPAACVVSVPRLSYLIFQFQIAIVYVFAAIWKLSPDWLESAQPLTIWLRARTDLPWVGPWMDEPWLAYAMSWGGALFDALIIPCLVWRPTRPWAYAIAVLFHGAIWLLFPIGMFSLVMLTCLTLFFDPRWPRRFYRFARSRSARLTEVAGPPVRRWVVLVTAVYVLAQVLVPLRFMLHPGSVNWTEEGFRFSWRVMLIEKTGHVAFRVEAEDPPRAWVERPSNHLTRLQVKQLSTQPDLVHQYALHIARRARGEGYRGVRVYADAWSSLNARPSQRFIDPTVDLASEPRSWSSSRFILPLENERCPQGGFERAQEPH